MRVFTKGMSIEDQAKQLRQDIGALKYRTLNAMADLIADTSPVACGTYAKNHEVALRSGSFSPNVVRDPSAPRRSKGEAVNAEAAKDFGRKAMKDDINSFGLLNAAGAIRSLADPDQNNFVFRNNTVYANFVEAEHAVYARARREVAQVIAASARNR